jgi:hypothetical protein
MELVITSQNSEPLHNQNEELINKHLGFLTSSYKKVVCDNFNSVNSHSLFGIRNRIKSRQLSSNSSIAIVLKVLLFLALFFATMS